MSILGTEINKIAVIGSGVMGSGIAAHMANAGYPVILMDIVPEGEKNRNLLAETAVERMLKAEPAPLTHKSKSHLITPANLEDNLDMLKDVDWIIEVVLEDLEVKKDLFSQIESYRKKDSIVSSNTSTIPLNKMVEDMPESFQKDFLITHFFNPPRYMRLLEVVKGEHTRDSHIDAVTKFADIKLGKGVVNCNDTAGFIANRIGCYWLTVGLLDAMELGISVEDADAIMGRPIGVPKTGVFGLMDLIGIDLMPLIAKSFKGTLPADDKFNLAYKEPDLITKMIADGYTGRKGKGGFFRLNKDGGKKVKEAINLSTGEYAKAGKSNLQSITAAKSGLRALVESDDIGGQYAKSVLVKFLGYTALVAQEVCGDIISIDNAMKWGYNWKFGPFELIDKLSCGKQSGAEWLIKELEAIGEDVPEILTKVGAGKFYQSSDDELQYFTYSGEYAAIPQSSDAWLLADKKRGKKPIIKNGSASLWDLGDGIACLEYTSKMNAVDLDTLDMIRKSIEIVEKDYKGLVIGNDADNFCVGANIGMALFLVNIASWKTIEEMIRGGQDAYMALKYANFPVVSAVSGMALGGGCEVLLHSDAVQAHIETYTGLVEVGVGVLPAWGGCKEMLIRAFSQRDKQGGLAAVGRAFDWINPVKTLNKMPAIRDVFMKVGLARVAKSAEEAREMHILNDKSRITMNRRRLLPDAKELCLSLAKDYTVPEQAEISLPGRTARAALHMGINDFVKSGKATAYDEIVSKEVANVLSGGDTDVTKTLSEQDILDIEFEGFMKLIKQEGTWDRIEHMLETGKPLRN